MKRECQPDETINSMIKKEQPKPRRSKNRVKVSFEIYFKKFVDKESKFVAFILSFPFQFFVSSAYSSQRVVHYLSYYVLLCHITFGTLLSFNKKCPWRGPN